MAKKAKTKFRTVYMIQRNCDEGACYIDIEEFPKTEEGLKTAYKRLEELNRKTPNTYFIHKVRLLV
jgi:hypothetical protein